MNNRESGKQEKADFGIGTGIKIENQDISTLRERINNMLPGSSLKEISDIIMDESKRLTGSENRYMAYVDPINQDSVGISFSHMTDGCQMYADKGEACLKLEKMVHMAGFLVTLWIQVNHSTSIIQKFIL